MTVKIVFYARWRPCRVATTTDIRTILTLAALTGRHYDGYPHDPVMAIRKRATTTKPTSSRQSGVFIVVHR